MVLVCSISLYERKLMKMTIVVVKRAVGRPSCMVRIQKPLRWLIRKAYRLVHGVTEKDKDDISIGDKGNKFNAFPSFTPNSNSLDELGPSRKNLNGSISTVGAKCDSFDLKAKPRLLDLPIQVRQSIYNLIEARDIASLRLTCSTLKEDIESVHGLYLRVHDGRFDNEELLQKFGIAHLNVEQLVDDNLKYASLFPYPQLLKTLVISGPISTNNLEFVLHISSNLAELRINFQLPNQRIPSGDCLKASNLNGLQILHISSTFAEITESPSVKQNIQDLLNDIACSHLRTFQFHVVGLTANLLHDYHLSAYKFITNNESLQKVDVQLKQFGSAVTPFHREDILLTERAPLSRIKELQLNMNSNNNMQIWSTLMDSQVCLRCLNLQMNGLSWNRLILTLDRNARTLSSLIISGLCSTSQDGITTVPVDFGLLRNMRALENLEIRQIDLESRGMESPDVLRTSSLPQSLKYVKLGHLRLKPHQAMFMMVKLPLLETLHLECWSDTEGTLAGCMPVVAFLIKFYVTPVKSLVLIDSRRRMENQRYEISKMINALANEAAITQTDTEVYSILEITRYI